MKTEIDRVKNVIKGVSIHSKFPYPTAFAVEATDKGIMIEAQCEFDSVETNARGLATPGICGVEIQADASDHEIRVAAVESLAKFMVHEAREVTTFDGKHIVDPHPQA